MHRSYRVVLPENSLLIYNTMESYLNLIRLYYQFRHISILTHFICFSHRKCIVSYCIAGHPNDFLRPVTSILLDEIAQISTECSKANFQSRFLTKFTSIDHFLDTPNHTTQGFIVDSKCENYERIFHQAIY